jgi:hypothetical protein
VRLRLKFKLAVRVFSPYRKSASNLVKIRQTYCTISLGKQSERRKSAKYILPSGSFKIVFFSFLRSSQETKKLLKNNSSTRILQCKNATQEHIFLKKEAGCCYSCAMLNCNSTLLPQCTWKSTVLCCISKRFPFPVMDNDLCLVSP